VPTSHLKRLLPSVYKLMPFELRALDKRFATLSTDVHTWTVGVQVLAHCSIVPKQLAATLQHQQHRPHISTTISAQTKHNSPLIVIFLVYFGQLLMIAKKNRKPLRKPFDDDDDLYNNNNNKLAPCGTDGRLFSTDISAQVQSHVTQKVG